MFDFAILFTTFAICSLALREFARKRATTNRQFYITLLMWSILVYECFRFLFPARLTPPEPYRHVQHRAEMIVLSIYGWEVTRYVAHKTMAALQRQTKIQDS